MSRIIQLAFLFVMFFHTPLHGQFYEVGAFGGMSAYRGDLNQTKLFNKTYGAGLMMRYSHNQHISARLNTGYTVLNGNDSKDDNPYIIFPNGIREYSFETTLIELSIQGEVNFLPFTPGDTDTRFTPYIFGGIGGIYFDSQIYRNRQPYAGDDHLTDPITGDVEDTGSSIAAIGLVGFGFKFNVADDFTLGAEWGFRFSNTDYLDEVSLGGNPKDNDYYSLMSLTLTYKFLDRSRPPCPMHRFQN